MYLINLSQLLLKCLFILNHWQLSYLLILIGSFLLQEGILLFECSLDVVVAEEDVGGGHVLLESSVQFQLPLNDNGLGHLHIHESQETLGHLVEVVDLLLFYQSHAH